MLLALLVAAPAQAGVQEIRLTAAGVDRSSSKAEALAMEYARTRAVFLAARKMGVADADKAIAKFTPEMMNEIIRGATVMQTKREGEVTYADVSVAIVDEALRRYLKMPDKPSGNDAATAARGVLLLPVLVTPERSFMWEKENALRQVLTDVLRRESLVGVMLSGADFDDLRLVDYENALRVSGAELAPMFERYGAKEVIIAVVTLGEAGTDAPTKMLLRRLTPGGVRHEVMELKPEKAEETSARRLEKAGETMAHAAAQIAAATSEEERKKQDAATKIPVLLAYTTPKEYASLQHAIQEAPHVLMLELPSIALNEVRGVIYLDGTADDLKEALRKQGVIITDNPEGWRASMR